MLNAEQLGAQIEACWDHYRVEGMVKSNMLASSKGSIYNDHALHGVTNTTRLSDGALGYTYSFYTPVRRRSGRLMQELGSPTA